MDKAPIILRILENLENSMGSKGSCNSILEIPECSFCKELEYELNCKKCPFKEVFSSCNKSDSHWRNMVRQLNDILYILYSQAKSRRKYAK